MPATKPFCSSATRRTVYAESILNVCKFFTESPTTCISGVMGSELKQRITRILSGQGVRKLDLRRKAMLALACVLAVGVPLAAGFLRAANGQTQPAPENGIEKSGIAGTWQGKEHTPEGNDLRMVLKIAKDEKGALSATLYSLDQAEMAPAGGSVSFQEGKLRFVNDFPGLTYEGTMLADGNSMSGTMTYAKRSFLWRWSVRSQGLNGRFLLSLRRLRRWQRTRSQTWRWRRSNRISRETRLSCLKCREEPW